MISSSMTVISINAFEVHTLICIPEWNGTIEDRGENWRASSTVRSLARGVPAPFERPS